MANLASRSYQYSLDLWVEGLNTSSTYQTVYIWCNGQKSPNLAKSGSGQAYSNVWSPNVSCGTSYYVSWEIATASNSASGGSYVSTTACPLPKPSAPTLYLDPDTYSISASWSGVSYADHYVYELRRGAGSPIQYNYNYSNTYKNFYNLDPDTSYNVKVYAVNADGVNGYSTDRDVRTLPPPKPSQVTNVNIYNNGRGEVRVTWSHASNSDYYAVEIQNQYGTTLAANYDVGYTTSAYIDGVPEYTSVRAKVYGRTIYDNGSAGYSGYVTTGDYTNPSLSLGSTDGAGRIYCYITASDSGSGLRSSNTYYVEISNQNGTLYGNGFYTTNRNVSFSSDRSGNTFVHNSYYRIRVTAYDNSGNSTVATTGQIQFKSQRPTDWNWHTSKIAGQDFKLTADEWNSFGKKVNQFRTYKDLGNYSFSTAIDGNDFTHVMYNQARSAIIAMPYNSTKHPIYSVVKDEDVTAHKVNVLMNALNSIT